VHRAWVNLAPEMSKCYLWIDYSCTNQDNADDPRLQLSCLDRIMAICDAMITPIFDPKCDEWQLPVGASEELWTAYQAEAFQHPEWGYRNMCWSRVEMLLAANLDLHDSAELDRISKFRYGLRNAALSNRRPHLLFGTKELTNGDHTYQPHFLPPLQNTYFEERDPTKGMITKEEDREIIIGLAAKCPVKNGKVGYIGQRDQATGKKHGLGTEVLANGDTYDGQFQHDLRQGVGKEITSYGDFYDGGFSNNKREGQGFLTYAGGERYVGTFANGKAHGQGVMSYPDNSTYTGHFENDLMHGA